MGGTRSVREEPGKQKSRSCGAQELARSSAQGNERQKKSGVLYSAGIGLTSRARPQQKNGTRKLRCLHVPLCLDDEGLD